MTDVYITPTELFLDGEDIHAKIRRIELLVDESGGTTLALFVREPKMRIQYHGAVVAVEPEDNASVMRRAVGFIEAMDASKIEERALEGQGMGSPKSMTTGIMDAIMEVFENAADELDNAEGVRGGADDGHNPRAEAAED